MAHENRITLCLPGKQDHAVVLRTMIGGVAFLKDLSVDAMDDLRTAADESFDCLLHQGSDVACVKMVISDEGSMLVTEMTAEFAGPCGDAPDAEEHEISLAVLRTVIPGASLETDDSGRAVRILLPVKRADG